MPQTMDPSTPATVVINRAREVHRAVNEAAELALRRLARQYVREQSFRTRVFAHALGLMFAEVNAEHVAERALDGWSAEAIIESLAAYLEREWPAYCEPDSALFSDLRDCGIMPEHVAEAGRWYRMAAAALREAVRQIATTPDAGSNGARAQGVNGAASRPSVA